MIALGPAAGFSAHIAPEPNGPSTHGWRAFARMTGARPVASGNALFRQRVFHLGGVNRLILPQQ
jgi:hypothetical protein